MAFIVKVRPYAPTYLPMYFLPSCLSTVYHQGCWGRAGLGLCLLAYLPAYLPTYLLTTYRPSYPTTQSMIDIVEKQNLAQSGFS